MKKLFVAVVLLVAAMFPLAGFTAGQGVLDFAMVQKAAEQGSAKAQFNLGVMTKIGGENAKKTLEGLK